MTSGATNTRFSCTRPGDVAGSARPSCIGSAHHPRCASAGRRSTRMLSARSRRRTRRSRSTGRSSSRPARPSQNRQRAGAPAEDEVVTAPCDPIPDDRTQRPPRLFLTSRLPIDRGRTTRPASLSERLLCQRPTPSALADGDPVFEPSAVHRRSVRRDSRVSERDMPR